MSKIQGQNSYQSQNAEKLRLLAAWEEGIYRVLAARFLDVADYSARRAAGRYLWEQAQTVTALKRRLGELPTGRAAGVWPASLGEAMARAVETEDEITLIHVLYAVIKPELARRFETYLEDAVKADEPSRDVVEEALHRTREQMEWARRWLRAQNFVADADDTRRAAALSALCQSIPPRSAATGSALEKAALAPFVARIRAHDVTNRVPARDPNWRVGSQPEREFESVLRDNGIAPDSDSADIVLDLLQYVREMQAAETLTQIIHQAPWEMPWPFFYDCARHCWDEVRHFEMGTGRLEELGIALETVPMPTANTVARGQISPLERYVLLVRITEAPRFPHLREKSARLRERGDESSATIVDFDHSDEITHVRFGEKWMPVLREKLGETRTLDEIEVEIAPRFKKILENVLAQEGESQVLEASLNSE